MLNSAEHEILNAPRYKNIKKFSIFRASVVKWLRALTLKHWISHYCTSSLARDTCGVPSSALVGQVVFSSPGQSPGRAIILPSASALAASALAKC